MCSGGNNDRLVNTDMLGLNTSCVYFLGKYSSRERKFMRKVVLVEDVYSHVEIFLLAYESLLARVFWGGHMSVLPCGG